ncbi:MAG TPA: GxxExxY protein [Tepidisphaeraceae bacterium]|jgi:GxxExxY protein
MILEEALSERVIGAMIDVHRELGPGLLESVYETCLFHELSTLRIRARRQVAIPVLYKGIRLDCGFRADLIIEEKIQIELKACVTPTTIHTAQVLTYLKLSSLRVGFLVNFNVKRLMNGFERIVL